MHPLLGRAAIVSICLLLPAIVGAQGERANITGTITDSTQAVIPGARVTARNVATNVSTRTDSNAAGIYYFPRDFS
jgi:hypothetical protein